MGKALWKAVALDYETGWHEVFKCLDTSWNGSVEEFKAELEARGYQVAAMYPVSAVIIEEVED